MDKISDNILQKYVYEDECNQFIDIKKLSKEEYNIDVESESLDNLSGYICKNNNNGTYKIAFNSSDHDVRQRFTIAHELGHYILHRDVLEAIGGANDNRLYRNTSSGKHFNQIMYNHSIVEREANMFAGEILMPLFLLKDILEKNNIDASKIGDITEPEIDKLAKILKVSNQVLKIRLMTGDDINQ